MWGWGDCQASVGSVPGAESRQWTSLTACPIRAQGPGAEGLTCPSYSWSPTWKLLRPEAWLAEAGPELSSLHDYMSLPLMPLLAFLSAAELGMT